MRAAFDVAKNFRANTGALWLCLGDMKELGAAEEALHRGLAEDIKDLGANVRVLLFGERMKWLGSELRKIAPAIFVKEFDKIESLAADLRAGFKADDFALIKGSRSMKMEKVWDVLKAK
jgi:UDP-N-acetylmuramoyl-tripeptide--D-alanyl-D-alanine ligase